MVPHGSAISGAASNTLPINSVQSANAGNYTVVVTNSARAVTSNTATLTVNAVQPPPSTGGGGGGGAPSFWFCGALSLLALARRMLRRRQ